MVGILYANSTRITEAGYKLCKNGKPLTVIEIDEILIMPCAW